MARTALIVKTEKRKKDKLKALAAGKKPKHPTRVYNRCKLCGRNKGYMRKFDMCRICFRELASNGKIMGVTKSSW
ncbi:MAG: type Z 30S ribosomal protein S14 [Patescibacteria group bacterium]|nr:type Z 30S ribosomal protein S14 [Patescibacteria group bacterium]